MNPMYQSSNGGNLYTGDEDSEAYEQCVYTYCGDRSKRDLEFAEQFLQHSGIYLFFRDYLKLEFKVHSISSFPLCLSLSSLFYTLQVS